MTITSTFVFIAFMFLFVATPGAGVFLILSRTISSGFLNAVFVAFGIALGDMIYLLFAIFGLSAIAHSFGEFFIIIRYIGGLYLLYLAYQIIKSNVSNQEIKGQKELSWKKNFLAGFFVSISNPKVILFYLSFLPSFMDLNTLKTTDIVLVVTLTVFCVVFVLSSYAYGVNKAQNFIKNTSIRKKIDYLSAGLIGTVGLVLIFKR